MTTQDAEYAANPTIKHWAVVEAGGGGMCPVQHWGTFCNGWKFYFRFRTNYARLNVAPPGTDMANVPLPNPDWNFEAFKAAAEAGKPWPTTMWWGPVGEVDQLYPQDPLAGFFKTEEDLQKTFEICFEQIKEEIGLGDMVCPKCKEQLHGQCPGGTWCDCSHRVPVIPQEPTTEQVSPS